MKTLKKLLPIMILVLFVVGFSQSAIAKEHADQKMADETITTYVKAKLFDNPAVAGSGIKVNTKNGVVTLTGVVAWTEAQDRAEELARSVKGVKDVNNLIDITPPLIE